MLDGSWREAKKMFRRSPYLQNSTCGVIHPKSAGGLESELSSRYQIRLAANNTELATAEVAAQVLALSRRANQCRLTRSYGLMFLVININAVFAKINRANPAAVADYTGVCQSLMASLLASDKVLTAKAGKSS